MEAYKYIKKIKEIEKNILNCKRALKEIRLKIYNEDYGFESLINIESGIECALLMEFDRLKKISH